MKGQWLREPRGDTPSTVVIFIHGLLSSGETCWRHENDTYWPDLLAKETEFRDCGIYEFSYNTGIFSGDYSLGDVVDSLKECLVLDNAISANRLVFVAHSMGGIVARRYIVQQLSDLSRRSTQIGLFLVASPSLGANYANWLMPLAKMFGHSQAKALAFCEDNTWLNDLNGDFRNAREGNEVSILGKELVEDRFIAVKRWGIFPRVVPTFTGAAFFGEAIKIAHSDHFSIAKPEGATAMQHRLLCKFLREFEDLTNKIGRVVESDGSIRATVGGNEIRVVFGAIDKISLDEFGLVALPCNEYFDNLCSADSRSALGAFVERYLPNKSEEFSKLVLENCRQNLGKGSHCQKTATETAESFGVGNCIIIKNPLGSNHKVALVSTTLQRAGEGLSGKISYLFTGMHNLFSSMADERINKVVMPLMGAGHGEIRPPLALIGILLALAEASRVSNGGKGRKIITVVVYKRSGKAAAVSRDEVRRALALVAND